MLFRGWFGSIGSSVLNQSHAVGVCTLSACCLSCRGCYTAAHCRPGTKRCANAKPSAVTREGGAGKNKLGKQQLAPGTRSQPLANRRVVVDRSQPPPLAAAGCTWHASTRCTWHNMCSQQQCCASCGGQFNQSIWMDPPFRPRSPRHSLLFQGSSRCLARFSSGPSPADKSQSSTSFEIKMTKSGLESKRGMQQLPPGEGRTLRTVLPPLQDRCCCRAAATHAAHAAAQHSQHTAPRAEHTGDQGLHEEAEHGDERQAAVLDLLDLRSSRQTVRGSRG